MTDLPDKPHHGQLLDARLHLLDRQLLDDEVIRQPSSMTSICRESS